jgi:hypothetical protein
MSEIRFSCPTCQQTLEAQPEHAGMQVNCPHCQTAMIVPQAQEAAPAAAPSAAAPRSKLSKAPSPVQHAATSPAMAQTIIRRKKKPPYALYAKIAAGLVAIAAAIYFVPQIVDKYQRQKAAEAAAKAEAERKARIPPEPPPLEADAILQKVSELYKELPSYSVHGESVANMDMSQVNAMLKDPIHATANYTMLLGRGGRYRVDWERDMGGVPMKGSGWSTGKGDFVEMGKSVVRMKNLAQAFTTISTTSGTLGMFIATTFFHQTNSLELALKSFAKTNNETLNGHKCYVLTGEIARQKMFFWIHRDDFLIAQAKMILSGKLDEADLVGLNAVQKRQAEMAAKIKGDIVDTYDNIETNRAVTEADFKVALPMTAAPARRAQEPGAVRHPKRQPPQ